ncbi:hypothetical protein ILYODFUR_028525 [Ilyodon furcidens]|uniref:Uncharacterized protein n=1 Tax=Ilyodon furcidens TaxID=33524 RepID=A0ABV0T0Z9_9TELE
MFAGQSSTVWDSCLSRIRLCVVAPKAHSPAAVHGLLIFTKPFNKICFTILSRLQLTLLLFYFKTTALSSIIVYINLHGYNPLWTATFISNDLLWLAVLCGGCKGLSVGQISDQLSSP